MVVWIDLVNFLSGQRKNRLVIIFGEYFVSWHHNWADERTRNWQTTTKVDFDKIRFVLLKSRQLCVRQHEIDPWVVLKQFLEILEAQKLSQKCQSAREKKTFANKSLLHVHQHEVGVAKVSFLVPVLSTKERKKKVSSNILEEFYQENEKNLLESSRDEITTISLKILHLTPVKISCRCLNPSQKTLKFWLQVLQSLGEFLSWKQSVEIHLEFSNFTWNQFCCLLVWVLTNDQVWIRVSSFQKIQNSSLWEYHFRVLNTSFDFT